MSNRRKKVLSNINNIIIVLTLFLTSSVVGVEVSLNGDDVGLTSVMAGSVGVSGGCFDCAFVVGSAFLNIGRDVVGFSSVVTNGFLVDFLVDE